MIQKTTLTKTSAVSCPASGSLGIRRTDWLLIEVVGLARLIRPGFKRPQLGDLNGTRDLWHGGEAQVEAQVKAWRRNVLDDVNQGRFWCVSRCRSVRPWSHTSRSLTTGV